MIKEFVMFELLNMVLSGIGYVFICYLSIAGIINFVWFILHLIFPNHIKYDSDIDFENDEGRFDGHH